MYIDVLVAHDTAGEDAQLLEQLHSGMGVVD